jgi:hypothetical protein
MFQGVRSRNAVISKVLDEFLDVVAEMDWNEIQREADNGGGTRRRRSRCGKPASLTSSNA